jgi:hypothetical protein
MKYNITFPFITFKNVKKERVKTLNKSFEFIDHIFKSALQTLSENINEQEVNLFHYKESDYILSIKRENYESFLESCKKHFQKQENYEVCSEINFIIENLKKQTWKKK